MKETTKTGTLCLNGLAIFLTIIFVISIVTMSGNTVSVQAKDLTVSYLTWTGHAAGSWSICLVLVIPGAILILGVVIWMRRRKQ